MGYGDLVPRTSIGKLFCICLVITATIYSAMPMSLVGSKFYELYERHMEKMVVKRVGPTRLCTSSSVYHLGQARCSLWRRSITLLLLQTGSIASSRVATRDLKLASQSASNPPQTTPPRSLELFALSERDLEILHLFMSMKRTLVNLQRNLDNFSSVGIDIAQQRKTSNTGETPVPPLVIRKTDSLEQSIEQKCNAVMVSWVRVAVSSSQLLCLTFLPMDVVDTAIVSGHAAAVLTGDREDPRRPDNVRSLAR